MSSKVFPADDKPPLMTPEEFIEHHGVKGMKWGVHKAKPTANDIHDARKRVASQQRSINNQIDKVNLSKPGSAQAREAQKLGKMQMDFLKNPDRATALRMTRGEKFLWTGIGIATAGTGIGLGVAAGAGARVAIRKSIERKQRNLGAANSN